MALFHQPFAGSLRNAIWFRTEGYLFSQKEKSPWQNWILNILPNTVISGIFKLPHCHIAHAYNQLCF